MSTWLLRSSVVGVVILGLLAPLAAAQVTWYVDDDAASDPGPGDPSIGDPLEDGTASHPFDAIQEAIDAAGDGDTVVILDGLYTGPGNRDLDFGGRTITVRSQNGPANCIIDCQGSSADPHRGFHFHNLETPNARLEGLTITGGYESQGGGIYCEGESSPTIAECVISQNTAVSYGAGIRLRGSRARIVNCKILNNYCLNDGGGISCANRADAFIYNCLVADNTAASDGGGLHFRDRSPVHVANCIVTGNSAAIAGGITCHSSSPHFTNCTIVSNSATSRGGGFWLYFYSNPLIRNSILWNNTPDEIHPNGSGDNAQVRFCVVEGGWAPGYAIISSDPMFVDPAGDFELQAGSPCIDAGSNCYAELDHVDLDDDGVLLEPVPLDWAGEGRFFDDPDVPDTGAFIFAPTIDIGALERGGTGLTPCLGDIDGDRNVNLTDLGHLLGAFGAAGGDLDCDSDTDLADLSIVLAHFGESCP